MKGLGEEIRALRKKKGLTLMELAKLCDMNQSSLSRIENNDIVGTLDTHMRLAQALGVSLPDLYKSTLSRINEPKESGIKAKVERFSHSSGAVSEILTTGILQKKMLPILLKLKPKAKTELEEYPALTERFIYVFKGKIAVVLGKDANALQAGERIYFDGSLPHYFKNLGNQEAVCLSIMTPVSM